MGQLWELFNVDRRERDLAGGAKFHMFFFLRQQKQMLALYRALQIPSLPRAVHGWLSRGTVVRQPGGIGKLSTEVLDMIFQTILHDRTTEYFATNLLSCICLSLGCKRLLAVGKRHLKEGLIEHHASAARCRLVCLGESTDATDQAPAGMLTAGELKEIAATKVPAEDDEWAIAARNEDGADPSVILERCLYNFATEFWACADDATWQRHSALSEMRNALCPEEPEGQRPKSQWDPDPDSDSEEPDPEPREPEHPLPPSTARCYNATYPRGPNVLLNLTKGECVREAALVVFANDASHVTLVHAMLSRICYSQDPSLPDELCGEEFVGRCGRGPWAGDRFCICSEKDLPAVKVGCGFTDLTDVTEEVNRLLGNLWRGMDCDAVLEAIARRPKHTVYVAGTDSDYW